jgi:hypothetical protein
MISLSRDPVPDTLESFTDVSPVAGREAVVGIPEEGGERISR